MNSESLLEEFRKVGAIQQGHFVLSSGLHSDTYVQCARVLERPEVAGLLCRELAGKWPEGAGVVAGPAYGGIILSYEIARALGARAIFFERVNGQFELRRGFGLEPGDRVLVAEDVVTTGGSAREVVELVKAQGGTVIGVASLVDRRPEESEDLRALIRLSPPLWKPEECPKCRNGEPIEKPGSRGPGIAC